MPREKNVNNLISNVTRCMRNVIIIMAAKSAQSTSMMKLMIYGGKYVGKYETNVSNCFTVNNIAKCTVLVTWDVTRLLSLFFLLHCLLCKDSLEGRVNKNVEREKKGERKGDSTS